MAAKSLSLDRCIMSVITQRLKEILIAAIIPYFINISSFSFYLSDLILFLCSFLFPHFPFVFHLSSFSSAVLRPLMSESKPSSPFQCVSSNCLTAWLGCCNILGTSLTLRRKQWFAKCYFFFLVFVLPLKSLKLGFLPSWWSCSLSSKIFLVYPMVPVFV